MTDYEPADGDVGVEVDPDAEPDDEADAEPDDEADGEPDEAAGDTGDAGDGEAASDATADGATDAAKDGTGADAENGETDRDADGRPGAEYPWRPADHPRPGFTPADHAQLALLLEVTGAPKPGNVDRARDLSDLRFEQFLAGGVGAGDGLRLAESGAPIGEAFETAVAGMSQQSAGNTQFGCLLNLIPLVRAAAEGDLSPAGVHRVVESTTVDDAVAFYRAFEYVDVAVADAPPELDALDVRRGSGAEPTLRERGLTLADVMRLSATKRPPDGNAREWLRGFDRSFTAAGWLLDDDGPAPDRVARAFLRLLAGEPDTLVWVEHGEMTARMVSARARAAIDHVDVGRRKAAAEMHGYQPEEGSGSADDGSGPADDGSAPGTAGAPASGDGDSVGDDEGDRSAVTGGDGDGVGTDGDGGPDVDADGVGDDDRAAVDAAVLAKGETTLLEFAEEFAGEFVEEGVNPGTTADVAAAATFVALERGLPL